MKKRKNILKNFSIERMDPLGQGVSRQGEKPFFIAKTLPGETGVAELCKSSKGVDFGKLSSLEKQADNRIQPECEHYDACPGCHYLHTDYESELAFKQDALLRQLSKVNFDPAAVTVFPALSRFSYRNRIQLHYRYKYIGFVDAVTDQVVEVPRCKIIDRELQSALDNLYADKSWAKEHQGKGHCELYLKHGEVHISWNKRYADGGFSQVNPSMNQVLKKVVAEALEFNEDVSGPPLLELFSGDGNLSDSWYGNRVLVDVFEDTLSAEMTSRRFMQIDLYDEDALKLFRRRCDERAFQTILLDPPRKGFRALPDWVTVFKPKQVVYVSCHVATLARDLSALPSGYRIDSIALIDLFPGTYHFETMVSLLAK